MMNVRFLDAEFRNFYLSYIGMMLYLVLLRTKGCPSNIAYIVYAISIVFFLRSFFKKGFNGIKNKSDVKVILWFFIYYIVSAMIFSVLGNAYDISWLLKDFLYSLLPILSYILIRTSQFRINTQLFLKITIYTIFTIDIISLIQFVAPSSSISHLFDEELIAGETYIYALSGFLGVIQIGFINVIGLAICLLSPLEEKTYLKYGLTLLFIICALLSGQRTPIGGILIILFCYALRYRGRGIISVCMLIGAFLYLFNNVNIDVQGSSVNEILSERTLEKLSNTKSLNSNREDQHAILIDSAFGLLFGDGVGCYSPNNPYTMNAMPDAMLFRIFNEMGIIGLLMYLSFWFGNLSHAIRKHDVFMIAFIIFVFTANYFNRVLFIAPISVIPYSIVALCNWNYLDKR